MKLKKLLLVILSLLLTINLTFSQQSQTNRENLENELGIDFSKITSPDQIAELVQIILEESDSAIKDSYDEGYKQAVLEYKPELDLWKEKYQKQNSFFSQFKKAGVYISVGVIIGVFTHAYLTK